MKKQKYILKRTSAIALSLVMLFSNLDTMLLTSMAMETDSTEFSSETIEEDLPVIDEQSTELFPEGTEDSSELESYIEKKSSDMEEIAFESNLQDQEMPIDANNVLSENSESISDETILDESILDESISDETILDETISDETILDETISDETILDESILDETISDETILDETISDETILDETISDETILDETPIKEVDTLFDLSSEVIELNIEDNLNSTNMYATKRLIVLSNTSEFNNHNATSVFNYDNLYILTYETEDTCKFAYKQLSEDSTILSVEVDAIMETEENDTTSIESENVPTETDLKKYLDSLTPSKEIKVAILDTGIDTSKFGNIIDLGINLSSSGEENSISDDNGHGTEMAELIMQNINSDYVKLMPIKIANSNGKATVLNTYLGLLKAIENDANIINISMNTIKSNTSQVLEDAISEASNKGIIVIVSAGNNSMDTNKITPANVESAIVVSAIDNTNMSSSYSNYGTTVDYCSYGTYGEKTGTSYAAANVTSLFANALSKDLDISVLNEYAIDLGDEGNDIYYGNGLISSYKYESIDNEPNNTINNIYEDWKNVSDDILNEYLMTNSDENNALFLQSLSEEDLALILTRDTCLNKEYNNSGEIQSEVTQLYYIYLLSLDLSELNVSATYGVDRFDVTYSAGYIRDRSKSDVIKTSGVNTKKGKNINTGLSSNSSMYDAEFYTGTNTSKSAYIDYSNAARYIDGEGNPKWLDMRIYVWTNDANYPWTIKTGSMSVSNIFNAGVQKTTMEYHFYESGTLNTSNPVEVSFKGVLRITDLDTYEGVYFYSGYDKFYRTSDTSVKYVASGKANSNNANNPFSQNTSKTSSKPYFFGTYLSGSDDSDEKQCVWVEINATPSSPFKYQYATRTCTRGSSLFYTGTKIEYYIDGTKVDTFYCVPYGIHRMTNPSAYNKTGYYTQGWFLNSNFSNYYSNPIYDVTTTDTLKFYGRYIPCIAEIQYHANGGTIASSPHYNSDQGKYFKLSSSIVNYSTTSNGTYSILTKDVEYGTSTINLHNVGTFGLTKTGYHIDSTKAWRINSTSGSTISQEDNTSAKSITNLIKSGNATVTLYANWLINQSTLTVNPNGGTWNNSTNSQSFTQNYNTTKTITNPTRAGYTFTGWSYSPGFNAGSFNGTTFTYGSANGGSGTITANWSLNAYTITCYDYLTDGTYLGSPGSTSRNYGASISGSEWGTSSPYNNAQYTYYYHSCTTINPVTGNCSVIRYWTRSTNAYTQTNNFYYYHPVNGWIWFNAKSYSQLYGTWYTSTNAGVTTPTGYHWSHFNSNGWTVTGNKNDSDGNGHYLPNTYTIVYNGNGNTGGSTASTSHTYDLAANLRTNGFTKTGYSFAGWATSSTGNVAYGNNASVINLTSTHNATINLYAKWNINQYTVTYIDVVDSTSGKQLGKTTKNINYGTNVRGSNLGSDTSDNKYYKGYYYVSDTAATVTTNGATVYRIFKLRTSTINGNINWEDWNNKNLSRPDNVTLHIHGSDGSTYNYQISGDNSKNTSINAWPYSKAVPKYDSNGNIVTYTVSQEKALSKEEGLWYKEPVVTEYDVLNEISNTPPKGVKPILSSVTTSIEWIDNDNQYGYRPNEVTIQLLQNGVVIDEVTTSKTSHTFGELYKYDENGDAYEYTITSKEVDRYTLSLDNERPYKKSITYTFQAPTFSVIIPKTVIIDGKTGIGEYAVLVQGNIDDRDFVNVIPDSSFTMENKYLSPTTATVKQNITSFTNKNNIKDGTTAIGIINTNSLAGEWSGSFNFNIYFEFGE